MIESKRIIPFHLIAVAVFITCLGRPASSAPLITTALATTKISATTVGTTTTISPSTLNINASHSYQFSLQIQSSLDPSTASVQWYIWPQVGSITNAGLYTAPPSISSQQTIKALAVVIPLSPTQAPAVAYSDVVVSPPVSVTVTPATATLQPSATVQLVAAVGNTNNTAITWSLSPAIGTISSAGLYTAPASIGSTTSVVVTATSGSDNTKSASSKITLTPQAVQAITLPVEVMGADGTTQSVQVSVPQGSNVSGAMNLTLQIHGLEYQTQASVRVNNGSWIQLNNQNVSLVGLASNFGGIGGGFNTLSMNVALPPGLVQAGTNTVSFAFNGTDGTSSGYRVLAFNFQAPGGAALIPASAFTQDNPANWRAPSTASSDISAGQSLFQNATITQPVPGGSPVTLHAHCGDCHTQDGHDLKYFNYSNNSISSRAMFHGLNSTQANQIVSYIRSLSTAAPATARPWNPPYQPGPGLDSQPVANWAAGAGLDAVLATDAGMMPEIAPTQSASDFNPTQPMNNRQIQLAMQLPDWNHWLPRIHPLDAFGSSFTSSNLNQDYAMIASALSVANASSYATTFNNNYWSNWVSDQITYQQAQSANLPNPTTATQDVMLHSLAQWRIVKQWDLMTGFELEGLGQSIYTSPYADARSWPNQGAFYASPALNGASTIGNGLDSTYAYDSVAWYELQIILNSGSGTQNGPYPVDWAYTYGRMWQINQYAPQAMFQMSMLKKILVNSKLMMGPPSEEGTGWNYTMNDISTLVNPVFVSMWANTSPAQTTGIMQGYVTSWLSEVQAFTPQQFYAGGTTSSNEVPTPGLNYPENTFASKVYFSIPRLKYFGVSSNTIQQLAAWAQTMWPNVNWNGLTSQTCTPGNGGNLNCQ